MNSVWIGLLSVGLLSFGYIVYGKIMAKVWQVSPDEKMPAHEKHDGVDYVPAKHWSILFGHHFASIAGAGPILGPVLATAAWGWAPTLLWILLGSILVGAVHDFSALMVSLRHQGRSIAEVSEQVMGKTSRLLFAAFLWLALILVVAVFAAATAKTLVQEPHVVVPTFGLIVTALVIGFWVSRKNGKQWVATIAGLALVAFFIWLGFRIPVSIPGQYGLQVWIIVLLLYALIASVVPVDLLLQPRDYLSTFILFLGLGAGYIGLFLTHYSFQVPAFIGAGSAKGPVWPMLFVFVACGAVSGFHSLVASGTTSKQLSHMKDAVKIGYGAMILEGILAVLALIAVGAGLYWTGGEGREGLVLSELLASGNWIGAFAKGFGRLTEPIFGAVLGMTLAVVMLNSFVMTTLDSATRISRYITEELFGDVFKIAFFKNRIIASCLVVVTAGALALGQWQKIWPIFGASNQLVAALTLLVITFYFLERKRPTAYTLYPALFMLLTTIAALVYQGWNFISQGKYVLAGLAVLLLGLAAFMIKEGMTRILLRKRKK